MDPLGAYSAHTPSRSQPARERIVHSKSDDATTEGGETRGFGSHTRRTHSHLSLMHTTNGNVPHVPVTIKTSLLPRDGSPHFRHFKTQCQSVTSSSSLNDSPPDRLPSPSTMVLRPNPRPFRHRHRHRPLELSTADEGVDVAPHIARDGLPQRFSTPTPAREHHVKGVDAYKSPSTVKTSTRSRAGMHRAGAGAEPELRQRQQPRQRRRRGTHARARSEMSRLRAHHRCAELARSATAPKAAAHSPPNVPHINRQHDDGNVPTTCQTFANSVNIPSSTVVDTASRTFEARRHAVEPRCVSRTSVLHGITRRTHRSRLDHGRDINAAMRDMSAAVQHADHFVVATSRRTTGSQRLATSAGTV